MPVTGMHAYAVGPCSSSTPSPLFVLAHYLSLGMQDLCTNYSLPAEPPDIVMKEETGENGIAVPPPKPKRKGKGRKKTRYETSSSEDDEPDEEDMDSDDEVRVFLCWSCDSNAADVCMHGMATASGQAAAVQNKCNIV